MLSLLILCYCWNAYTDYHPINFQVTISRQLKTSLQTISRCTQTPMRSPTWKAIHQTCFLHKFKSIYSWVNFLTCKIHCSADSVFRTWTFFTSIFQKIWKLVIKMKWIHFKSTSLYTVKENTFSNHLTIFTGGKHIVEVSFHYYAW